MKPMLMDWVRDFYIPPMVGPPGTHKQNKNTIPSGMIPGISLVWATSFKLADIKNWRFTVTDGILHPNCLEGQSFGDKEHVHISSGEKNTSQQ